MSKANSDTIFDLFSYIMLSLVLLVIIIPLIFIINASFSDPDAVNLGKVLFWPVKPTIEGYIKVYSDSRVWLGYKNVITYTIVGTGINVILTILGAYPLSRKDFAGRNVFTFIIAFTMFFNGGIIPFYLLIKNLHFINTIWAMVLPGAVWVWNLIIARTYFQTSIPDGLKEAAHIDGCNNFVFLIHIVIPLSLPIIAVLTLFYGIGHWNDFMGALLYLNDEKKYPLQLVLRQILLQNQLNGGSLDDVVSALERQRLAEIMKYSLIIVASVPLLIAYPFLQRYFVKGVMIGSIKG